jgi:hypothetical protein
MIQREEQKLQRAKKVGKEKIIVKDEYRKNEWKLRSKQREFEAFDDDTICTVEVQRDEYAAQVAEVFNDQSKSRIGPYRSLII